MDKTKFVMVTVFVLALGSGVAAGILLARLPARLGGNRAAFAAGRGIATQLRPE